MKKLYWIIALIIAIALLIYFSNSSCTKSDDYSNKVLGTEIHYAILWGIDKKSAKNRILSNLGKYDALIVDSVILDRKIAEKLLENEGSGGKKTMEDKIEILFIEVPDIYAKKPTHDHPDGERVNSAMYNLKVIGRGDYTNYKVMHCSINEQETEEFFKAYFRFLGSFSGSREIIKTLNDGNIWWLYDRVDPQNYDEKDVDLIVSSIPIASFYLRKIHKNCGNSKSECGKIYVNVGDNTILYDLQDFNSNYYPKEWLQHIMDRPLDRYDDIPIAQPFDRLMLGLYHYHIHKKGNPKSLSQTRRKIIDTLASELNITYPYSAEVLYNLRYFIPHEIQNISIKKDKRIDKLQSGTYLQTYFEESLYYKNKRAHTFLDGYPHFPHLINSNDTTLEIQIENVGRKIREDEIIPDLYQQISDIRNTLDRVNLIHGDVHTDNMTIKNGRIYVFDFDHSHFPPQQKRWFESNACFNVPPALPGDTWKSYIQRNPCIYQKPTPTRKIPTTKYSHHYSDINIGSNSISNTIPNIIHTMWISKEDPYGGEDSPSKYDNHTKTWFQKNPDALHYHWNGYEVYELISKHFPQYLDFYQSLSPNIKKCDFARFAVVAVHGGLYRDLDFYCLKNVFTLFQRENYFIYEPDEHVREYENNHNFGKKYKGLLFNGFFAACKNDSFVLGWLQKMTDHRGNTSVMAHTGPDGFARYYNSVHHKDIFIGNYCDIIPLVNKKDTTISENCRSTIGRAYTLNFWREGSGWVDLDGSIKHKIFSVLDIFRTMF